MKIVNSLLTDKWMSFVNNHPSANIFHSPHMMDVFQNTKNHLPFLFAALNEKDEICGLILAVQVKTLGNVLPRYSSRVIVYGGLLWESSRESNDGLMKLITQYDNFVSKRSLLTEVRNINEAVNIKNQLRACGYQYEEYLNFLIDLNNNENTILRSFSKGRKSEIKRAERLGYAIEEVKDIENISSFYKIMINNYSRIKVPLADLSLFESAFKYLSNIDHIKIFLACFNGSIVGAIALLIFKGVVLTWYYGSNRNASLPSPESFLIWHALKWAKANNCHTLDFGGAGRPDEKYGVRDFKAHFGGKLVNYGRFYKVYSPFKFKISTNAYQVYRTLL